ncbi:type I CRISPR-associated protein Cas7 [Streptomyces sp. NPDC054796]
MPRTDPSTSQGIITDVALKRKIRNTIALAHQGQRSVTTRRGGSPPSVPTTGIRHGRERSSSLPRPSCRTTGTTPDSRRS